MRCVAVILAAGIGTRFRSAMPKQYQRLGSTTVLRRTIEVFRNHPLIDRVIVVINPAHREYYERAVRGVETLTAVTGGSTRQDSLRLGLEYLSLSPPDWVIVHDACRPFVPIKIVDEVLSALQTDCAVTPAVPAADGLRRLDRQKRIVETIDRTNVWRIQSPRGYHFEILFRLFSEMPWDEFIAEPAMFEAAKIPMAVVQGSEMNFKITTEQDLHGAQSFIDFIHSESDN
jgi:2-C-methyl-D-erythritol 4-phosphate cytidylyltransferase/2-C-methyl-D-erythritol 2,4-cyclodiphosphate synthase